MGISVRSGQAGAAIRDTRPMAASPSIRPSPPTTPIDATARQPEHDRADRERRADRTPPARPRADGAGIGTSAPEKDQITEFMIVPALVAIAPPAMAPAIIFGDCKAPPFHFSQAKRPPP